jgi:hypothetical protein
VKKGDSMLKKSFHFFGMCIIPVIVLIFCNRVENPSDTQTVYTLKVTADSCGAVVDSGVHRVSAGGAYELIAGQPSQGCRFAYWSVTAGEENVTLQNRDSSHANVVNVQGNAVVKAVFRKSEYHFSYLVQPANSIDSIIVDPEPKNNGLYDYGTEVKVRVVPVTGWKISKWDRILKSNTNTVIVTVRDSIFDTISCELLQVPENVICVKWDAPQNGGGNIGSNWVDAFTNLNTALTELSINATKNTIWIAQGTYKPADQSTFFLIPKSNVAIVGGFFGVETDATQRDSIRNTTILDGDINTIVNAAVVVNVPAGSDNVLLSTLTIQNANGTNGTTSPSGGIFSYNANNTTLFRCVIQNNYPWGIQAGYKLAVKQCAITNNNGVNGTGISIRRDSVMISQSVITKNTGTGNGGGIYVYSTGSVDIVNSTIVNNSANSAGGIYKVSSARMYLGNSIIFSNTATTTTGTQINYTDSVYRCDIQDTAGSMGIGVKLMTSPEGWLSVLSVSPQFVSNSDIVGPDGLWFTNDDGYMLNSSSSCVNAGRFIPRFIITGAKDIRGETITGNPDAGAYDR